MDDLPDDATIEQCRERLTTVNRCWSDSFCDCHKQLLAERILEHHDALAARLAEAEALLREAREPLADIYYCEKQDCIACRIDAFLTPAPPAPDSTPEAP